MEQRKQIFIPHTTAGLAVDTGIARDYQEDCVGYAPLYRLPAYDFLARNLGDLYVLSDGAGGHEAGDIASEIGIQVTLGAYYATLNLDLEEALVAAIRKASERVGNYAANTGISARATLVCAVIRGNELCVANVGDSRAYLVRQGQQMLLSVDHTLVGQWVEEGKLSEEEAKEHAYRHVITQALGGTEEVYPSVHWEEILPGDAIVLCSDGLSGVVDDTTIAQAVSHAPDPQQACQDLIQLANNGGGPDNISVIVIHIHHLEPHVPDTEPRIPVNPKRPTFEQQEDRLFGPKLAAKDPAGQAPEDEDKSFLARVRSLLNRLGDD